MDKRRGYIFPGPSMPSPASRGARGPLDRAARVARTRKLKLATAVAGIIATAVFSGLAANAGGAQAQGGVISADQQVSRLEQANGGAFFSLGGSFAPPQPGNGGPQTSSGGS